MRQVIVDARLGRRDQPPYRLGIVVLVLGMLVGACGGGTAEESGPDPDVATTVQDPGAPTTMPSATEGTTATADDGTPAGGECTVTITGDREETWTFGQSVYAMSSDYWLSEDDLRGTVEALGVEISGGTYEELAERGEPVITFLSVGCLDPDDLILGASVTPTNLTRASDLPMGPGSYPITGGFFDADGAAGTIVGEFAVSTDELYGTVPGTGSLEITRWDLERIEGSFSFDARESFVDSPREISVSVTFSYQCGGWFSGC